jgi:uncharacterized protein
MKPHLGAGLDPELRNERAFTLLMIAAFNDYSEMVDMLLQHGASADRRDGSGNTPVMGACFEPDLAKILKSHGAGPTARDAHGLTAAGFVSAHGNAELAAALG